MKRGEKIPEDHIRCPKCQSVYGFVKCRITGSDGKNQCLSCAVIEEKEHEKKRADKKTGGGINAGVQPTTVAPTTPTPTTRQSSGGETMRLL